MVVHKSLMSVCGQTTSLSVPQDSKQVQMGLSGFILSQSSGPGTWSLNDEHAFLFFSSVLWVWNLKLEDCWYGTIEDSVVQAYKLVKILKLLTFGTRRYPVISLVHHSKAFYQSNCCFSITKQVWNKMVNQKQKWVMLFGSLFEY